jgi:hypothetical protein
MDELINRNHITRLVSLPAIWESKLETEYENIGNSAACGINATLNKKKTISSAYCEFNIHSFSWTKRNKLKFP